MVVDGKTKKITKLSDFLAFKGRNELKKKIVARTTKRKTISE
jgi:hypothetical protein